MPYCQYCGTKLEDGQNCTCEMARAAASRPPQPEQIPSQQVPLQQPSIPAAPRPESKASIAFKKFKLYLSLYISNPSQAVQSVVAEEYSYTIPIILTVIRLLSMGLAIYGLLRKVCMDTLTFITTTLLRYGSAADILTAKLYASLPVCLFFGALIAAVGMLLFIVMALALVKIQHGETTISGIFKASAANGVLPSALLLLAFLFSFTSTTFCLVFFALAALSWVICGVLTIYIVCPNHTSGPLWLMYFIGVVLIVVVSYYTMPMLFSRAVGGITASYGGETATLQSIMDKASNELNNALAEAGVSSIAELYRKLINDMYQEVAVGLWRSMY